jgi:hypothetical protein
MLIKIWSCKIGFFEAVCLILLADWPSKCYRKTKLKKWQQSTSAYLTYWCRMLTNFFEKVPAPHMHIESWSSHPWSHDVLKKTSKLAKTWRCRIEVFWRLHYIQSWVFSYILGKYGGSKPKLSRGFHWKICFFRLLCDILKFYILEVGKEARFFKKNMWNLLS